MKWLEIHIDTAHAGLEGLEALLSAHGIDQVVIDDGDEFREFLENNRQCWDYVDDALMKAEKNASRVTFYLEAGGDGFSKMGEVRVALAAYKKEHPEAGSLLMTLDNLEDADWENNWKQYYKPIPVGRRLLIVPAWEKVEAGERVKLVLNPGLTFGTGSHATTQLCLEALERHVRGGERVLDLGCGSGILSIAALKLGAASAVACDIDDKCMDVVYENAALNGIGREKCTVRCGDILTDGALQASLGGGYDLVLANIVADVIIGLAPRVRALLASGGLFLCSGIIDDRAVEVADALRLQGLAILETRESKGWFAYVCR